MSVELLYKISIALSGKVVAGQIRNKEGSF
jgi:hypothetical protein